jgi:small subunit ribosomal protein S20
MVRIEPANQSMVPLERGPTDGAPGRAKVRGSRRLDGPVTGPRQSTEVLEGFFSVANHASALKAHRQSLVNRERNRQYRSKLRTALKDVRAAVAAGKIEDVRRSFSGTVSLIDKLATKGIIHRNAAGRYKSRLMKKLA